MKKLSFLFLAALALGSCKKNDDNSPAAPSKTDLLTAKSWRVTAQTSTSSVGASPSTTTDEYASTPACERDNFTKFNSNKSATYDEGTTKCSSSDPQTQNGTWDLSSDGTKLTIVDPSQGGVAIPFDVITLSATTLQLRYTSSLSLGGTSFNTISNVTFTSF